MRGLFIIGLLALLAACTPESRQTLPEDFRIAPDQRFLGAWRSTADDGASLVSQIEGHITADAAGGLDLHATVSESWMASGKAYRREGQARLRFYNVSGRIVLAVQLVDSRDDRPREEASWRFATYRFGGDADERLVLHFMNERHVYNLVHAARLPGQIRGGEAEFPDLMVTASSDQLAALVRATEPATLFSVRLGPLERF